MNKFADKEKLSLYIHIPFCVRKCNYCDFLSFPCERAKQEEYLQSLLQEIKLWGKKCSSYQVDTIFIGGGTPSILNASQIKKIMQEICDCFEVQPAAEITIESNPGTLDENKLKTYLECGINRLSMGLQSADDRELQILGRIHHFEDFRKNYLLAREIGFTNINVDLMTGLPGQNLEGTLDGVKKVLDLHPEHISAYSLIIEPGTPFYEQQDSLELPDEDLDRIIYYQVRKCLRDAGYYQYELSNYSLPGKECRHNIGYWTGHDYLGLGLGASSMMEHIRFKNPDRMEDYQSKVQMEDYQSYMENSAQNEILSLNSQMEEFMFLGLRMTRGVAAGEFENRFHTSLDSVYGEWIRRMVTERLLVLYPSDLSREQLTRLLEKENNNYEQQIAAWPNDRSIFPTENICLTEKGMDLANYVMAGFLFET